MMRYSNFGLGLAVLLMAAAASAQQVVDRVAARIEGDIILESEVRELGEYQQLVEGKAESQGQRLDRLIDQWIVRGEAETARFPRPNDADMNDALARVRSSFASPDEFENRRGECGLSEPALRRILAGQLFLTRYLDSRFRAAAQVEPAAIEAYYHDEFVPRLEKSGVKAPSIEAVHDQIREILIDKGINEQASKWLAEARARVHVEKVLP